ncbi:hypothetical protein LINPERHAP2_LOCUS42523 [Linum perenne]
MQPAKLYKLKHLSKVEVVANDPSGCTFTLENTGTVRKQRTQHDGPVAAHMDEGDMKVTVERELVSQAEEEDMEALLDTTVILMIHFFSQHRTLISELENSSHWLTDKETSDGFSLGDSMKEKSAKLKLVAVVLQPCLESW